MKFCKQFYLQLYSVFRVKELDDYVDELEKKQNGEQASSKCCFSL